MYVTVEEASEYLNVSVDVVERWILEGQVRTLEVDGEVLLYKEQFNLYQKEREKLIQAYEAFLEEPIPEDIDIKDED